MEWVRDRDKDRDPGVGRRSFVSLVTVCVEGPFPEPSFTCFLCQVSSRVLGRGTS